MGDIADDIIDSMFDDFLTDADEWDDSYQNPFYRPQLKSCRNCGTDGFHWEKTEKGWRLFDAKGLIHSCRPKPPEPRHWKIRDRMGETEESSFTIADMRLVEVDAERKIFDLEYYDADGKIRGSQRLQSIGERP
jgi:hypothetical protein